MQLALLPSLLSGGFTQFLSESTGRILTCAASHRWAWEVIGLASAALGTDNLGANSVLGTSASLLYQLPAGLTVACAVRVGNLVGAQYPYAARTSAKTAMTMSTVIGFFNMGLLILLRKRWGRLFSSDEKVVAIVADVIPLVGVFQVTDCITGAAMGVLRGTGLAVRDAHSPYSSLARSSWLICLSDLQTLGAQINLVAYWVIGIRECLPSWVMSGPTSKSACRALYTAIGLALTFSRLHWQLYGLWSGLTIALTFTAIVGSIVVARINWPQIVKDAKDRNFNLGGGGH